LGIEYPYIAGRNLKTGVDVGGDEIYSHYKINATPTMILIAPNRAIVEHKIWPNGWPTSITIDSVLITTLDRYDIDTTGDETKITVPKKQIKLFNGAYIKNGQLNLKVNESGRYRVSLYDLKGRAIMKGFSSNLSLGENNIHLDTKSLRSNILLLKIEKDGVVTSTKIRLK
jgi:hypothetical protein